MLREHLEKLRSFAVVARVGSFRRAAERLRVSQPALSQSIQILESALGRPLLVRSSRGVTPTEEGVLLRDFAERMLNDIEGIERSLEVSSGPMGGHFRIGTFETLTISLFPGFVAESVKRFPKLSFSILSGTIASLAESLLDRSIHIAVLAEPKPDRRLAVEPLFLERYRTYVAPSVKRAFRLPLIIVPYAVDRDGRTVQDHVAVMADKRPPSIALTSFEAVKAFTLQGIGIGVLPELGARAEVRAGHLQPVDDGFGEHRIVAQTRADQEDARVHRLVRELKSYAEKLTGAE